ncbi:MAG TPA: hypothetical protein PLV03_02390 [Clostridiales bacterium]|nr:hypothetical protein [Clostridiales bacterium]
MADEINIHLKILEWLMTYTPLKDWYFNFNNARIDAVSVVPVGMPRLSEEWIDGGGIVYYDFIINVFKPLDKTPHFLTRRNANATALFDVQAFMDWITEKDATGDYPVIGYDVESIEVLQNIPSTAGQDDKLYLLSFPGRMKYIKED